MDYYETLNRWAELKEAIRKLTAEERALREGLFGGAFPDPKEGVNNFELPDGRILKGTYKLNRKVDQEGATALPGKLRNKVFRTKLELNTTAYKNLDDEDKQEVDRVLTITPGLPSLQVVEAKPGPEDLTP